MGENVPTKFDEDVTPATADVEVCEKLCFAFEFTVSIVVELGCLLVTSKDCFFVKT